MTKNYLFKKLFLISFAMGIFAVTNAYGQVTIGSGESPQKAAILEIKNQKAETLGGVTATKGGIILPRVELLNNKQLSPFFTTAEQADPNYEAVEKPEHKGLFVYHVGNNELAAGVYVWSGAEWELFGTKSAIKPVITAIQCGNASINPSVFIPGSPYEGVMKIPYTGGNGGSYSAGNPIPSTGNTGLIAALQAGTLAHGNGELIYTVTGTPNNEDPATFAINFLDQSCQASVSGQVLGIGQTITFYTSTDLLNGQYLSSKYPALLPVIDGIRMDLKGITGGSGQPSVEIFNENNSPIVITTIGTANSLNAVSVPAQTYRVVQTGLNWSATPSVAEVNIMVKINETTYRWYTLKWLGMQAGSTHAIFLSAIRVA